MRSQAVGEPGTGVRAAASTDVLAAALAAGGLGVWTWDRATDRFSWGDPAAETFAPTQTSFCDTLDGWLRAVHPDDHEGVVAAVRQAIEDRGIRHMEYRIVCPDGTVRWLECSGKVTVDGAGVVTGAVGVMGDITARLEVLAESEVLKGRLELLAAAGQRLIEADGVNARLAALARAVVPGLGACSCVHMLGEDGGVRLAASYHHDEDSRDGFARFVDAIPVTTEQPRGVGQAIASGLSQLVTPDPRREDPAVRHYRFRAR